MKIAIVGGGWAGMAAAVTAVQAGHAVTLWEASRVLGGRARALPAQLPDGSAVVLDNGQHILIGAYRECLRLMQLVGVDPEQALLRLPLRMRFPDGGGVAFPPWPAPLDALAGIATARGWQGRDKLALLLQALRWRLESFQCDADRSVADLCRELTPRVRTELIEPLCVSALNTEAADSSGQVFLRVLQDAMFSGSGGSDLLLPRIDLSAMFPDAAAHWLRQRGATVHVGSRVQQLAHIDGRWHVGGAPFDRVLLATSASEALHLLQGSAPAWPQPLQASTLHWIALARTLKHMPIATVYAWAAKARLDAPMLALRAAPMAATPMPAQFVFDRGQLGGPAGLLAFVVSASRGTRDDLQAQVLQQARAQLGLQLQAVQSVVEKRATIACTPGLKRPPQEIADGLLACADYVDGPYPSTLEGAVRSAIGAIGSIR
ncbi:MAG: FAD-dependent oxidoreductase [Rhodoferax sp.]|nr:FAD-dependent oxidoreductase [Rhodoferax sp.]